MRRLRAGTAVRAASWATCQECGAEGPRTEGASPGAALEAALASGFALDLAGPEPRLFCGPCGGQEDLTAGAGHLLAGGGMQALRELVRKAKS